MAQFSRTKRSVTTPAIADATIEARLQKLGVNFSEYVNSLITYDCWAEKDHAFTGDACKGERIDEERLWKEIIADAGKPNKVGSYFEHRVAALVMAKLKS